MDSNHKKLMNGSRMLLAFMSFIVFILALLVTGSKQPFGIARASESITPSQVVSTGLVKYQDEYYLERAFIGQVEPNQLSDLGFELTGLLNVINFEEGDLVKKGDIIAVLDTDRLVAQQSEARANLAKVIADARLKESTLVRTIKAFEGKAVSAQELDQAKEDRESAIALVSVAKSQLDSITVDINKSSLIAPFDGTIVKKFIDVGTVVRQGQTIAELQENKNFEVRIGISNNLINSVQLGDQKNLLINSNEYLGIVSAKLPSRGQNRTIDIILELTDTNQLRAGDLARLSLKKTVNERGFWVPLTALREGKRGLWSIYIASHIPNKVNHASNLEATHFIERRTVIVEHINESSAYVSGAVDSEEQMIIEGAHKLVPGQLVRIKTFESDGASV